jgi:hypothetical protein
MSKTTPKQCLLEKFAKWAARLILWDIIYSMAGLILLHCEASKKPTYCAEARGT